MERQREQGGESIRINGTPRVCQARSVHELLIEQGYDPERQGIAVALNDEVIPRHRWSNQAVRAGDRIEIVGAVQGG